MYRCQGIVQPPIGPERERKDGAGPGDGGSPCGRAPLKTSLAPEPRPHGAGALVALVLQVVVAHATLVLLVRGPVHIALVRVGDEDAGFGEGAQGALAPARAAFW